MAVGKLSKIRFYAEDSYGGGKGSGASAADHAVDAINGPGPNHDRVDKSKIAGAYGTTYSFYGKQTYERSFPMEVNDDNDQWIEDAGFTRTANVQTSYEIQEYDAGGQYFKARGCKCGQVTFEWDEGGELIAVMDWKGNGDIQSLSTTDGISTFTPETYNTNVPYNQMGFSVDGNTTWNVVSMRATVNNNLIDGPMNSSKHSNSLTEGEQEYDLELTIQNPNSTSLIGKMDGGTKITATVTGSDGTNYLTMTFSDCIISEPAAQDITPEEVATLQLKLKPTGSSPFTYDTG